MKRLIPSTILVAAMVLLLLTSGRAADKSTVEGLVVPDSVFDKQPFTFAVPQTVEGEVVNIRTVDGEVVQHASADKYGRIFLAAGLPAGAYMVSAGSHGQPIGKLEIKPQAGDALQHVSQPMRIVNPPQVLKLSNPFSLNGTGFNPNCADMRATLNGSGKTEAPVVLASTKDQLKLAPIQYLQPGMAQLRVTNQATGQSTEPQQLLLYNISGELGRHTIRSGRDETQLTLKVQPANMALTVKVNVVSGPVDFGQGRKEVEAVTDNGQAVFPVHAEHGAGAFQLSWALADALPIIAQQRNEGHIPGQALPAVSEDLFPDGYIDSPRFDSYGNLLNAKIDWLEKKRLRHQDAINEEKKMLNAPGNEGNKATLQAEIDQNTAEVNEANDELKILRGNDEKAKKALVKKNVEKWIRELEARIRELHKIQEQEKKAASDANNKQDRERHEANAKDAADEARDDAKEATDLSRDLEKAKL